MIFGVSHVSNNFGVPWFVLFVDDCTQKKSEVNLIFPIFHKMEANQFNRKIRILRSYDEIETASMRISLSTFRMRESSIILVENRATMVIRIREEKQEEYTDITWFGSVPTFTGMAA